jgi:hypothetical protein
VRAHAAVLGGLAGLFLLRVLGQALVAFGGVGFLPPMPEWHSGLVPYPLLLPAQLGILGLLGWIVADLTRRRGAFAVPRPRLGRALGWFGALYAAAMLVRYAVTMALHPERRWLGTGTIPIVFHWVLAGCCLTLAHYHARRR